MVSYLFSIRPEVFEKIRPLIEAVKNADKSRDGNPDREERLQMIARQMNLENEIVEVLLENKERHEYLDDEKQEGDLIYDFEHYFMEKYPPLRKMKPSPTSPEIVKSCWERINLCLEKEEAKKEAVKYTEEIEEGSGLSHEKISAMFDKWVLLLRHAAENSNWYYYFIGME